MSQITEEFVKAADVLTGTKVFQGDEGGFRPADTITGVNWDGEIVENHKVVKITDHNGVEYFDGNTANPNNTLAAGYNTSTNCFEITKKNLSITSGTVQGNQIVAGNNYGKPSTAHAEFTSVLDLNNAISSGWTINDVAIVNDGVNVSAIYVLQATQH